MKLTVLGSGTGWLTLSRRAPCYLVSIGNFHLLLDLGPGSLYQLLKTGLRLEDISAIFISHFHPDHITDIIPFFFASRYHLGYQRKDPVYLIAHESFKNFYQGLLEAFGDWIKPPENLLHLILIPTLDLYSLKLKQFKFITAGVNHNPESLAIRLEYQGKSLIYSGDTGWSENLVELANRGDLVILECSNSKDYSVPIHLGPEEIKELAIKANPKKILLSHFYPHSENPEIDSLRVSFQGEIIIAEDLQTIEI